MPQTTHDTSLSEAKPRSSAPGTPTVSNTSNFDFDYFLKFISQPYYLTKQSHTCKSNIKYTLSSYLFCTIAVFILSIIINILDKFLVNTLGIQSISTQIRNSILQTGNDFNQFNFIIIVLATPFIEEIIFRLPLNLNKYAFATSTTIFTYIISGGSIFHFSKGNDTIPLLIAFVTFTCLAIFINNISLLKIGTHHFRRWFYAYTLLFGIIHVTNIRNIQYQLVPIYLIYILPQIAMGLFIANIRLHRGFAWGFALHALINGIGYMLIY